MEKEHKTYVLVPKRLVYLIVVTLVTAMLSPFGTIVYVNYVDRKNRGDWCELIVVFDDSYKANPPTTPTGQQVAQLMERRRHSLGCK